MADNSAIDVLHDANEQDALKKTVQELTARLAQYEGEGGNVAHPRFKGEVPRYRLNSRCFLEDDTLHEEGEEIEYLGVPNGEMVPLNEAARKRSEAFIEELTEGQRQVAAKNGRNFNGLILDKADILALAGQDARRAAEKVAVVSMPEEKGTVYPMPHLPDAQAQQRRRGRPPKSAAVVSAKAPAPPKVTSKPADVLGTRYTRDSASNTNG